MLSNKYSEMIRLEDLQSQKSVSKDYLAQRHIVKDLACDQVPQDFPDMKSKEMNPSEAFPLKPSSNRYQATNIKSNLDIDLLKKPYDIESRRLNEDLSCLKETNNRLQQDHKLTQEHYEDYISQLEKDNNRLNRIEKNYDRISDTKRSLEEEISKLLSEIKILRRMENNDENAIGVLRNKIV